jgi:hypothetical protein
MATRAPSRPDDLVSLRQAAALVGRSVDTVRDWRERYGLKDWRDPSTRTAPSAFSRGDVLAIAARIASTRPDVDGVIDGVILSGSPSGQAGVPSGGGSETSSYPLAPIGTGSGTALVQALFADLQGERDRLRQERDEAVASVVATQRERDRLAIRLAELETVVAHGRRAALDEERARLLTRGQPAPSQEPKPKPTKQKKTKAKAKPKTKVKAKGKRS